MTEFQKPKGVILKRKELKYTIA